MFHARFPEGEKRHPAIALRVRLPGDIQDADERQSSTGFHLDGTSMSDYLTQANSFEHVIDRGAGRFRSGELDEAVKAIRRYIKQPSAKHIASVRNWLAAWKHHNPKEFADRGAPIQDELRAELHHHLDNWHVPKAPGTTGTGTAPVAASNAGNVKQWIEQRRGALETLGSYACGDLMHPPGSQVPGKINWEKGFATIANPLQRDAIWKRYCDQVNYRGMGAQHGMLSGKTWKGQQFAGVYSAVTGGKRGVCTTFGQAAAHVLTKGIPSGPRVEVVTWGNQSTGHVFVLVNRKGGYSGNNVPDSWVKEKDVVIVDPWRGSLGWQTISFGITQYRSGMVAGLMCVGEKPAW